MGLIVVYGVIAYLLGSFSSAYWFGTWFHGIDIREHGSGNAGATNLLRVIGWKAALPAFIMDVIKSYAAVNLAWGQSLWASDSEAFVLLQISLGVIAVIGHIFPLYSDFRGGKGVASLLGVVLAIHPLAAICALGVFVLVMMVSKIVSLGSMIAGISFPIFMIFVFNETRVSLLLFSLLAAFLLLLTHKKNIYRLLNGQEKRIHLK
jgi:glycerol-3-phosphate acyltransferase PlsY